MVPVCLACAQRRGFAVPRLCCRQSHLVRSGFRGFRAGWCGCRVFWHGSDLFRFVSTVASVFLACARVRGFAVLAFAVDGSAWSVERFVVPVWSGDGVFQGLSLVQSA